MKLLYLAIVAIAVLRSSSNNAPSILLCNAWVSTVSSSTSSSSSSGSTGTSAFSSLASSSPNNNAAAATFRHYKYSPSIRSTGTGTGTGTADRRYWMVLNAVVDSNNDNRGEQENGTTYESSSTSSSSSRSKSSKTKSKTKSKITAKIKLSTTPITKSNSTNSKIRKNKKIFIVDRWNAMFKRLEDYKVTYGTTSVPKKYNNEDDDYKTPSLGNWVHKQRFEALVYQNTNGEEGQITPDRVSRLDSIGFVWEMGRQEEWEEKWLSMYAELLIFTEKYQSTKVPILNKKEREQQYDNNNNSDIMESDPMSCLGRWVKTQRIQYTKLKKGEPAPAMSEERLEMLESIEFAWKGKRVTDYDRWLNMYFKLLFYHQRHNTTIVSDSDSEGTGRLLKWTEDQRAFYKQKKNFNSNLNLNFLDDLEINSLTQHRVNLLNEIDFDWAYRHDNRTWDEMYNELAEYKENFNSTLISTTINEHLGKWTELQRTTYNSKDDAVGLDEEQIQLLNNLDFDWKASEDVNWSAMMDRLDSYKHKHDTTIVPNHDGGDRPLANWVNNQRVKLGKYVLDEKGKLYTYPCEEFDDVIDRIAHDLGCDPDTVFKPYGFVKQLSPKMKATRIKRLNKLGFVWDAQEASWQEMYQRLLVYKEEHDGCTMVPFFSNNPNVEESLAYWVKVQRHKRQIDELSESRMKLLNEIDFEWDPQEAHWAEMFERLILYQAQNGGSTKVSRTYAAGNPELGVWLNTQRRSYKRKTLLQERIERLDSIGFAWECLTE